ncbi:MAG: hypothetical protein AB1779_00815 [Candidatus Thermoplasmatota archaeon]
MVERINVSIPEELAGIVRKRGWSPSALLEAKILEELMGGKGVLISYPSTGVKKTLPIGVNIIDFYEGDVRLGDRTKEDFAPNFKMYDIEYGRSFSLYPSKKVVVWLDDKSPKYPVDYGNYFTLPNAEFKQVYVETTVETEIVVWAHSQPYSAPTRFIETMENSYKHKTYALDTVFTDDALGIAGLSLTVFKLDGTVSIKFNSKDDDEIEITALTWPSMVTFELEYTNVYLTNKTAQAGKKATLFFGKRV